MDGGEQGDDCTQTDDDRAMCVGEWGEIKFAPPHSLSNYRDMTRNSSHVLGFSSSSTQERMRQMPKFSSPSSCDDVDDDDGGGEGDCGD